MVKKALYYGGMYMNSSNNRKDVFWTSRVIALLLGIIFILISIISDNYMSIDKEVHPLLKTAVGFISKGISAVGISLVVGFVTAKIQKEDKKRKEEEEREQINKLLQNTIVSKEFICGLDKKSKANIIQNCLNPKDSNSQMSKYILYKINKLQEISDCTVRSNIDYITTASIKDNTVILKTVMSYRIYPINGVYSNIQHDFDKESGKILQMKIVSPKGKTYNIPTKDLKTKEEVRHYNEKVYTNLIKIPKIYVNEEYLTLKITVEEVGFEHWAHLIWMSLYPTETISYKIICQNNLIIKNHMIFDNQKDLYYVQEQRDDKNNIIEYTISCDKWTDPYTGFALVIAKP